LSYKQDFKYILSELKVIKYFYKTINKLLDLDLEPKEFERILKRDYGFAFDQYLKQISQIFKTNY
jgi:hypothetical protein